MSAEPDPMWEKFAQSINEGVEAAQKEAARKEQARTLLLAFAGLTFVSFVMSLCIMWGNHILVRSFPNATWLQPGIGYQSALQLSFLIVILRLVGNILRGKT